MIKIKENLCLSLLIMGILSGCHHNIPKPETKVNAEEKNTASIPVEQRPLNQNLNRSLFVQHKVKGDQVFVECILTGISFREQEHTGRDVGKLVVWVDGKRTKEFTTAVFILKNLPPGDHKVKLEVVNLKDQSYGLTKEFLVNIPKR